MVMDPGQFLNTGIELPCKSRSVECFCLPASSSFLQGVGFRASWQSKKWMPDWLPDLFPNNRIKPQQPQGRIPISSATRRYQEGVRHSRAKPQLQLGPIGENLGYVIVYLET